MSKGVRGEQAVKPGERFNPLGFLPLREFFSLDVRSLALLRIGLSVILLCDWLDRLPDLRAHYSDAGIVPRNVLSGAMPISVHFFSGAVWFQALLLGLACLFALALLVGYRTPLATLVSWFLLISVHARNPAVLQGGDQVLRLLLFWGIFLPLGACYSLDSADPEARPRSPRVLSPASVALILQVCLIYWFASAWKWGPEWRTEGTAVYFALKVDHFSTHFGRFLLGYPEVMRWLTYSTLYLETLGPVLLFVPFHPPLLRLLAIASFVLFHAGLAISLELSHFPPVCALAWLSLLPTDFWDRLGRQFRTPERAGLKILYAPDDGRARRVLAVLGTFLMLPGAALVPADGPERRGRVQGQGAWEVEDAQGKSRYGLDALAYLVGLSPVFGPLAGLVQRRPLRPLAQALCAWLASPRPGAVTGRAPAWAPPQGLLANTVVIFCLVAAVLYNFNWFLSYRSRDLAANAARLKAEAREQAGGSAELAAEAADLRGRAGRMAEAARLILPDQTQPFFSVLAFDQGWGLFAPGPGRQVGWAVAVGVQKDGTRVDLPRGGPEDFSKPEFLSATYANGRWRKLLMNLPQVVGFRGLADGYAAYLGREWNRTHHGPEELVSVEVYWMREVNVPPGEPHPPVVKERLFPPPAAGREPGSLTRGAEELNHESHE
jgi:hypothetical protein